MEKIRDQKDQLQLKRATLLRRKSGTLQIQKVINPSLLSTAGAGGAISPRIAKIQKSKMGRHGGSKDNIKKDTEQRINLKAAAANSLLILGSKESL